MNTMPLTPSSPRYFITGGAGFIGSHLADRLLETGAVTVYDNLSSGRLDFIGRAGFTFIRGDLLDAGTLDKALAGHDVVFHLAANPEVRAGITATGLDLKQGTEATRSVLEAMRLNKVKKIVFTSSSTVYGEAGTTPVAEDYGPLIPISLYGAAKLSSEAFIAAFCHLFDLQAWCFRLGNVIGGRLTHGVIYDFLNKLRQEPARLVILGDGRQEKPYLHIAECLNGMLYGYEHAPGAFNVFNLAPDTTTSVTRIAETIVRAMGLKGVKLEFTGGRQGWRGDVPRVLLDTTRLGQLGWRPSLTSDQAVLKAVREMLAQVYQ
jgi:UDP-glucose 4-epimerase